MLQLLNTAFHVNIYAVQFSSNHLWVKQRGVRDRCAHIFTESPLQRLRSRCCTQQWDCFTGNQSAGLQQDEGRWNQCLHNIGACVYVYLYINNNIYVMCVACIMMNELPCILHLQ